MYIRSQIASGEHSRVVSIYDVTSGQISMKYEEHEKRVWSVHFSPVDPMRLVSASDDTKGTF